MNFNLFNNGKKDKEAEQRRQQAAQRRKAVAERERQHGDLVHRNPSLGTTGIATQPVSPKLDDEVYNRLHNGWAILLNDSHVHPQLDAKIEKIMTHAGDFHDLPTFHRPAIAHQVAIDLLGLGVIARLFRLHPDITDMGYNGKFLTYKTNDAKYRYGQQNGEDASLLTPTYIARLINKLTYNEQNDAALNSAHPIFNGMYKNLRVSITDTSLTPLTSGPTFSLRMSRPQLALNAHNFKYNSPMFIYTVLNTLMKSHANILISGITGSGKTELQKMLVGFIQPDEKIIMIEDVPETHLQELYPDKDILMWETSAQANLSQQVANSLRNDSDWVMVSETRNGEAYNMFQSVKTGHHLTTTLHASSNATVPSRFVGMCEEAPGININPDTLKNDFVAFMNIGIHTDAKKIGGHMFRFIDEIAEFVPYKYRTTDSNGQQHIHVTNGIHPLFQQELENRDGVCIRHWRTFKPTHFLERLVSRNLDADFKMPYAGEPTSTMRVNAPKPGQG